ncbi:MAG: glycosyltransferase family 4 protein [Alphaproteobacteria bacterium]|nr:glycosyltransferase family 4 protein [Alphaproteobacteria bacterium]
MWQQFDASHSVDVHPIVGFGRRYGALASTYPRGFAFPLNYGASGALAIVSKAPFPGARWLAQRIDVYHATDYWIPKLSGVPVVATLHDAIPLSNPEWATPQHRAVKNFFMRAAAQWADAVITVSAAMVPAVVEQFRVPPERVTVIHNGVDDEWFQRIPPETGRTMLARHGLAPGYFLTVGTLQPRKNLARLFGAYRALPDRIRSEHPLVIVGQMGWGMDDLLPAIRSAQAVGEVFWLDYVLDAELRAIFQGACALVFPSLYEGFGMPVVEAFASGVPVLTSNVSALPEVAGDAALQVDPCDVEAIRDAMLRLAENSALCAHLVAAGSLRAKRFSWQTCAEQVAGVYRKVART